MPDKPAGEKTEKPTPKRIEKAREEGRVAQSQELPGAIGLIALVGMCAFAGKRLLDWFSLLIREGLSCRTDLINDGDAFTEFFSERFVEMLWMMSPFMGALLFGGIIATLLVGGATFTGKPLKFKTEELSIPKGFKRLFSMNSLVKLFSSIAKLVVIGAVVAHYMSSRMEAIATFQWISPADLVGAISQFIFIALIRICIALLVIAIAEAAYQKWKYNKNMMMTKQEVKEERKSQDGAPEIKSKIRQLQFQMATRRMLQDVPDANVIIVNPTHYAVAVKYDNKTMAAPVVVAKGADLMCEKIKEIARSHGVPIIRRPAIARNLHANVDIGEVVPEDLFVSIAEVLAMIYRIKHNR